MNVVFDAWILIQVLIGYNLVLPLFLYIIYMAGRKKSIVRLRQQEADYAIIVTAYQQTAMLPAVVKSLLNLQYTNYIIYIVADDCDVSHLQFDDPRVVLFRPPAVLASNTASHFYAIRRFKRDHERVTIIDSDNLVHPDYLNKISVLFNKGFHAVQGVRRPKNLDTTLACLDGARDIYYHFYDGKVLFHSGSSATLCGSGMAFTTDLYRRCLEHKNVQGAGFDKVLQFELVKRGYRIAFAEDAIVYDEKTSRSGQLVKQRARWVNTWFKYFSFGFTLIGRSIQNFSRNQFLFGLVLLRPPLFIFLLLSIVCLIVNLFIWPMLALLWFTGLLLFGLGFLVALASEETDRRIYRSLVSIPQFVYLQVKSLLKAKKANQYSVATEHFHEVPKERALPEH
jgi:cellulose synthase/poly-beta-1,6-N-acetylglucosamine synthase-like glycosyltransferase